MIDLLTKLYPICSSITGNGLRLRLKIIQTEIPIHITETPSDTQCFDWNIPKEWNINDAWIKNSNGDKIIDLKINNLHLMNYSIPVNKKVSYIDLIEHLYFLENQPDAIPYLTTYYSENWGFCLTYNQYLKLDKNDEYEVFIDSSLEYGSLSYGDILIKGESEKELLFSCYLCHPSMCNDSLSGVVVSVKLVKYLLSLNGDHYYSYRFVFVPETIGSICYLSANLKILKENVIGGYVLTTCGDEGQFTFLKSINENSLSNKVGLFVLDQSNQTYKLREFYECGSDERQYNSPGIDLNIASLMKSKYYEFKEYHTSDDNFNLVTEKGLLETFEIYKKIIYCFENNFIYKTNVLCEAKLGKYNLYPKIGGLTKYNTCEKMFEYRILMYYLNGNFDLIEISSKLNLEFNKVVDAIKILLEKNLISKI